MYDENLIYDDCILRDVDPYFAQGYRKNLRYVTKDYAYACLMDFAPEKIEPLDYIHFSKSDLLSQDLRGAINALNNAKRAIHLLIDCFLEVIGIFSLYRKDNFPNKLAIIDKLEAFPVSLIKNLNSKRNIVEHEYKAISVEEAQAFVEIAEIFVRLCYPYLRKTMIGSRIGFVNSNKDIEWMLYHDKKIIRVCECSGAKYLDTKYGTVYFNFSDRDEKKVIKRIHISKDNIEEWIPILNTFIYCSQKLILPEPPPYDPKYHERVMTFKVTHAHSETVIVKGD